MAVFHRRRLEKIIRDVLLGRDTRDLALIIRSPTSGSETKREERPVAFERRRASSEEGVAVGSPHNRLIRPASRSRDDVWSVLYKDTLLAEGRFGELEKEIAHIPGKLISYPSAAAARAMAAIGLFALIGFAFFAGYSTSRVREPVDAEVGLEDEKAAYAYVEGLSQGVTQINSSVHDLLERQDVMKTILVSGITDLKSQKDAARSKMPAPQAPEAGTEASARESLQAKLDKELGEVEFRQLVELEAKKADLILKDKELESQGLKPLYNERRSIAASLETLDRRIAYLKKRLGDRKSGG